MASSDNGRVMGYLGGYKMTEASIFLIFYLYLAQSGAYRDPKIEKALIFLSGPAVEQRYEEVAKQLQEILK